MLSRSARLLAAVALAVSFGALARATPYTDPGLLEVPWGNYSFVRQGWRGYLETLPAARFLDGLGIVWSQSPPGRTAEETAADLAWTGFKRVRLEIPWGSVKWDETGLNDAEAKRIGEVLRALRSHRLRPLILLNANHLQPCPVQWRELAVSRSAEAGSRSVVVTGDINGIATTPATIMSLADGGTAGPLIVSAADISASGTPNTTVLRLSKPLSRTLGVGDRLRVALLRYAPLYPVGTREFDRTVGGWLRYVSLVTALVTAQYGSDDFDVEIWNELTFGSAFLSIDNYDDAARAQDLAPEPFHPGGRAWELANRTVQTLKVQHPSIKVIWGFSNTTFFHVPIAQLPRGISGQSYHPYGTGRRCYVQLVRGKEQLLLDAYVPQGCAVQPEGYAQAWQQTESLLRFLAPAARQRRADGAVFEHYVTEHGLSPEEIGISDPDAAERAKAKFLQRAPLFWLNKGLTALYVYAAYDPEPSHWGVLRADGSRSSGMAALHRLVSQFAGAVTGDPMRQLQVEVSRLGAPAGVLPGDEAGEHLPQEQAVAVLPFQVSARKLIVCVYVMTQNFPEDLPPQPYRIAIAGVDAQKVQAAYYAPLTGSEQPLRVISREQGHIMLELSITDTPQLIELTEGS